MQHRKICNLGAALCCCLLLAGCHSNSPVAARYYNEGNSLFAKANFRAAIEKYEEAVTAGAADGELFYNLGTAHFQSGDLGKAILWYLRTQRLAPRDPDLRDNLNKVRNGRKDSLPGVKRSRLNVWWAWSLQRITHNETLGVELSAFLLAIGILLLRTLCPRLFSGRRTHLVIALIAVVWVVTTVFAISRVSFDLRENPGVITVAETKGRNGPGEQFPVAFTIHEGLEVQSKRKQGTWRQVRLSNGWTGWVKQDAVESVDL